MNDDRDGCHPEQGPSRRTRWSWALYDWANSAFATTVVAGFFPAFFKQYWNAGVDVGTSTFRLGLANSSASLLVLVLAPLLGAMADRASAKKRFLLGFAALGIVMTAALYWIPQGGWLLAATCFAVATIGFSGGNIFYDALLVGVAEPRDYDRVSALGYSLGYLGGGLLFALNVAMTLRPELFGLEGAGQAVRVSFLTVAVWWAAFSIPLLLWVPEPAGLDREPVRPSMLGAFVAGWQDLARTWRAVRALRPVVLFLVAYWFYIDGVHTVIRMAVDYGLSIGLAMSHLITALLITQFVGFPSALAFGAIGDRWGPRRGIYIGLAVYTGVAIWGYFLDEAWEFYLLAVAVGLVQGGVQALSRSLYARLVPPENAAQFFGFFNMFGKFAAIMGPALMGAVSYATGNPRLSILAVVVLFAIGALLLARVPAQSVRSSRA